MSEAKELTVVPQVFPVVSFGEVNDQMIDALADEFKGLTAETPANYKLCKESVAVLRKGWVGVGKTKKTLNEGAYGWIGEVNGNAKHYTARLKEIAEPIQVEIAKADAVKQARIQAKRDKAREKQIAEENAASKEREAEHQAKINEEREQNARLTATLAEQTALLEELRAKQAADKEAANRKAAEQTALQEELRVIQEAEKERIQAIRDKEEAAKKLAADREASKSFALDIITLKNHLEAFKIIRIPKTQSYQAEQLLIDFQDAMEDAASKVWEAIHTHEKYAKLEEEVATPGDPQHDKFSLPF